MQRYKARGLPMKSPSKSPSTSWGNLMISSKILLLTLSATLAAPVHAARIKFATLAPEGTDAMVVMREIDKEVQEKTGGKVKFKFYAGGRQGDEKDMVRKIRIGQLHSGGFTGVGLGEIAPEVRILDAPWLFQNLGEVDHIYKKFSKDFEAAFDKKGYILLGWTEVGWAHVFSNTPLTQAEDFKKLKIWVWEGDPIAESAFKALGVHPIPLSIADVNTSLQTGLINAVYSAPLYAIALQWHEKTKYIYSVPLANASGAVLLSKRAYKKMTPAEQKVVLEVAHRRLGALNAKTRAENDKAFATLKKSGLQKTAPKTKAQRAAFYTAGAKARRTLIGRLYSKDLLTRVEKALTDLRNKKAAKKK
jgi:TRAP-type C4-dicarboxylate transport system substrate-binding protein